MTTAPVCKCGHRMVAIISTLNGGIIGWECPDCGSTEIHSWYPEAVKK